MEIKRSELKELARKYIGSDSIDAQNQFMIKVSTARCARLSYMTFDGEIDYEKDIKLHDRLLADNHMSPFEHCCRVLTEEEYQSFFKGKLEILNEDRDFEDNIEIMEPHHSEKGWCRNYKGFIQYRYMIDNKS